MRILLYIFIILIGALLGSSGKLSGAFIGKLSKLQFGSLLVLLFIMGVNIGVNDVVIKGFYRLGFQAVVLALFSIAFSVLFVRLVSGFIVKDDRGSE
ncbi:MAG: hypothetical protein ACM3TR_09610 [Caulobacteraceae bacterium]